jgi:hypothetical protein
MGRKKKKVGRVLLTPAFKLRISMSKLAEDENFKIQAYLNIHQIRVFC